MKVDITMPKMGESLQEGTIQKWLKGVGDVIERDEMILEISTDKVDTEVPSPKGGKIVEILAEEGETVEVGTKIAVIETDADASSDSEDKKEEKSEPKEEVEKEEKSEPNEESTDNEEVEEDDEDEGEDDDNGEVTQIVMPKMGESLQEGTIQKWLKQVGDKIERDEMILEISTDKVDTEVPAPKGGTLIEILAEEGETVEVGTPIAKISQNGSAPKKSKKKTTTKKKSEPKEDTSSKKDAASSKSDSSSISVPENGTTDIPARSNGKFFSPLVRNIAEDKGITLEELEQIDGSGIDKRVTKDDLLEYIDKRGEAPAKETKTEEKPKEDRSKDESATASTETKKQSQKSYPIPKDDVEVIPMDRVRQLIAEHMVYSSNTSPHVTTVAEVDVTDLVNLRNKYKQEFLDREGIKLTFTPFFIKAIVDGIRKHPMINVSVDGKNVIRHKKVNMGVATALPDGNLIVPVIRKAEELNITGLARQVNDLASRARSKKLQPDEIQGGTISITNFGSFGALFGTPIINQPQTAIIGVGAIKKQPAVVEVSGQDMILVRHIMMLSITFDHRVIDGMLGGQALEAMVNSLENMNENTIDL